MPSPYHPPVKSPTPQARSEFLTRLAYYAMGLSIGLVMLGLWQMERRSLLARSAAEAQAQQAEMARKQAEQLGLPPPESAKPAPTPPAQPPRN